MYDALGETLTLGDKTFCSYGQTESHESLKCWSRNNLPSAKDIDLELSGKTAATNVRQGKFIYIAPFSTRQPKVLYKIRSKTFKNRHLRQ